MIGGREYKGLSEAAAEYGVTNACICYWLNRGYDNNGQKCYRLNLSEEIIPVTNFVNNHTIIYNGKEYTNKKDLSKDIDKSEGTINRWLNKGYSPDGIPCRYKDDPPVKCEYVNQQLSQRNSSNSTLESSTTNE